MLGKLKSLLQPSTSAPAPVKAERSPLSEKKQGDDHLQEGRLDAAVACYRRALGADPNDVDAHVALGFALSEQEQFAEAEQSLLQALAIDPSIADPHYILGTIAKKRNEASNAIDRFRQAVRLKPDFEFAHRDLVAMLFDSGDVDKTKEALRNAIAAVPRSAEFLFYLGNVLAGEGDHDGAIARYRDALAIEPASAQVHKKLGDALQECGDTADSVASYRKAIWFDPDAVDGHIALAGALENQEELGAAIAAFQHAATIRPDNAFVQIRLGLLHHRQRNIDEAIACFKRARNLAPNDPSAHQGLGNALLDSGAKQEAMACFEEVVKLDPESPMKHLVSALSGAGSESAPSDYVEKLFDQYASKFDTHLVGTLSYSVPQKLAELLRSHYDAAGEAWTILDLGCGTGLSGVAVAPFAGELVGVDLSAKMLEKAHEKNLYQRLVQLDLSTMVRGEPSAAYDVVLAADVFVYIGKLDELVVEAARLLRPGGLFAFSVESLEALTLDDTAGEHRDYRLNATGRYAHSRAYLARMAGANGFEVLTNSETQSRLERGNAVHGYLVVWRKPGLGLSRPHPATSQGHPPRTS